MSSTRRHFLHTTAGVGLAVPAMAQQAPRVRSVNDQLQYALIGAGIMGSGDAESAQKVPGVKLVAVADVYEGRLERAKERWGKDLFTTRDFREVLTRPDIDAVIIGTPDHLHAPISIAAMNAGKDVYCEKPMIQKPEDGLGVIETHKSTGRIMQIGSQGLSSILHAKAKELIRSGAIGQLNMVEATWNRNSPVGAWQYAIPPDASPQTVDWDKFIASAPKRPFEPIRLFRWRNYKDYGTGVTGDLFVHLFSSLHFILDSHGPNKVFATGGLRFWKDGRDVPDIMLGIYDYPETASHPPFNLALRVNFESGDGENTGMRFVGSHGVMTVGDSKLTIAKQPREKAPGYTIDTFPQDVQAQFKKEYFAKYPVEPARTDDLRPRAEEEYHPPKGYDTHVEHHRVFANSVRTRKPLVEDPTFGLRAAGPAVLSNLSYTEKRVVRWDPETMVLAKKG